MSLCQDSKYGYVYWRENGVRQRYKAKAPFFVSKLPRILPKLKPIEDCKLVIVGLYLEKEAYYSFNDRWANNSVILKTPIVPDFYYTPPPDPSEILLYAYLENVTDRVVEYFSPPIQGIGLEGRFPDPSLPCEMPYRERLLGGVDPVHALNFDVFPPERIYIGQLVGGIISVTDFWTGEEYVEDVKEHCVLTIYDANMNPVFTRILDGECSQVEIQCEGDCPPGSCKCWISRAAGTFCCAKCGKG